MIDLPVQVRDPLKRLSRRVALGMFLDVWPRWAAGAVLAGGLAVLVCRVAVPSAAAHLGWSWLIPVVAAIPAAADCRRRRFRDEDVAALADSLAGGRGTLLAVIETRDAAWFESPHLARAVAFPLPRLQVWRRLAPLAATLAFLALALALPQRVPAGTSVALAGDIAKDLTATVVELKQQGMVSAEEQKKLDDEIERIRRGAAQKVDAGSWEAADSLREKLAADVAEKQHALAWAQDSFARYAAAAQRADGGGTSAEAQAAELSRSLQKLEQSGLLAGAPEKLRQLLKSGKLPTDAASLRELSASFSKYMAETNGRFGNVAKLGKEFGRFDPAEFPLPEGEGATGDEPGNGGIDRGRADAPLTWGKETSPLDRFKAKALPPGAARSADDWAPLAELPGAPQVDAQTSIGAAGRQYAPAAGQAAWRRGLAPRHQSAVKKYFAK